MSNNVANFEAADLMLKVSIKFYCGLKKLNIKTFREVVWKKVVGWQGLPSGIETYITKLYLHYD